MKRKPVILFNFGYSRKGWIEPIEALKDELTIIYLYYIHPVQESVKFTEQRIIYWSDFASAHQILDEVRPDKVVFMSVDSGLGIVLNYTAKKREIPTYILQHGIYSHYKDYREREKKAKKLTQPAKKVEPSYNGNFSTLQFLRQSLSIADYWSFLKFPFYNFLLRREGPRYASRWVRFGARIPQYYICYSPHNTVLNRELDDPEEDQFMYIGNPEMDKFTTYVSHRVPHTESYYLLIDQALAENRFGDVVCSKEYMTAHYLKLNRFCIRNKARLKVKLHPESYQSDWLPSNENIDWIRDSDSIPSLIGEAKGCFGYFSTLTIPAICYNQTVLFQISKHELQQDAQTWGLAKLLNFLDYSEEEIDFNGLTKENLPFFIKKYLYASDGKAVERLKKILQ